MKNESIQFEIIDYRKSKSQPQWVTIYLSRIRSSFINELNLIINSKTTKRVIRR